jgi:hypothetical protein
MHLPENLLRKPQTHEAASLLTPAAEETKASTALQFPARLISMSISITLGVMRHDSTCHRIEASSGLLKQGNTMRSDIRLNRLPNVRDGKA